MENPLSTDTLRGRTGESRIAHWLLLDSNRWLLAGLLSAATFVALVGLGALALPLREMMANGSPVDTVFQALIAGILTGVTLVVSINQLVLSQELGRLGDQQAWMNEAMEYRRSVEELFGTVGPPDPSQFLQALVQTSAGRAEALQEAVADNPDETLRSRTDRLVENVRRNSEEIDSQLETSEFGEFGVLRSGLNYNYSWKIYAVRRLRHEHEDSLGDDELETFDELIDVLGLFGPALEHFKSLYFQWELVHLTRSILYAGLPGVVVATATVLYLEPDSVPGTILGVDNMVWVVSASTTITLVPFFLLAAYVLRIATISKRTGSLGPFILRQAERTDAIDWEK
ncbi:hypothetical protein [Natronorubrum daqingense]|uniref:Uncharacterized protein n=1 Tax=Natronorubrum daqingense TaxID=588898 RepID=A0A1N7BWL8_9EURY|nr:hypothetical protein [Natronorubrum daqingense]APX96624.1 hypothetical protein BB347_08345 [Natronorubrum daqingense]SIR55646.1 hypothetical protein SAMN05421809_1388 [Natronorubrum daqingense]